MDETREKHKIYLLIFFVSFAFTAILMPGNLLYDEFWSLLHFVPLDVFQILTDLSLPNNHPVNTLLLKIMVFFSDAGIVLRLPSLLCGAAIPVLCGQLAYKWSRTNHFAALISAAIFAAFSAPLAIYSGLARGYAVQLFFLLLCIRAMSGAKENPRRAAVWMSAGAIGTFLSVPTGALFLLPAAAGFLIYTPPEVRKNRDIWISAGVIAVAGALFYGINFSALQSGQSWGNKLDSVAGFGAFLGNTLLSLTVTPVLLAALPVFFRPVKRLAALGLLFCPLLLSVFTNSGPERCYLFLAAALAVSGGIGVGEFTARFRHALICAVVITAILSAGGFALQFNNWRQVDYIRVFDECRQELPPEVLPVLRSTAGFPVLCGISPQELTDFNMQISGGNFKKIAVFECANGVFNGLDANMSENLMHFDGVNGEAALAGGLPCRIYEVHPVESAAAGECMLIICPSGYPDVPELLDKHGQVLYLNAWLTKTGKMALFKCETALPELPGSVQIYRIGGCK